MKNIPKVIYLNFEERGEDFKEHAEITWSEERINDSDIRFVLSDNSVINSVSNRDTICKKCQKEMIIDMMNEQVYCDDCGDQAGGKCDNLDCKHK